MIRLAVIIAAAVVFAVGWNWRGSIANANYLEMQAQYLHTIQLATQEALAQAQERDKQLQKNAELAAELAAERKRKNTILTQRVVRYVQNPDAGHCALPADWVQLHDDAARAALSDSRTATAFDAAARTITDADAIVTIAANYQSCNETRAALIELQGWAKAINTSQKE